jgi:hypothetical protein
LGQTLRLTSAQTNCAGKKQTPRQRPFWGARLLVERKASASDRFIFRNSLPAFVLVVGGFFGAPSHAENLAWPGSLGTFGTPGLIDMPTAIVPEDAEVSGTFFQGDGNTKATFTFQVLPRISGSFRYSQIDGYLADGSDLLDRSFDLRFTLAEETNRRPSVVVGLQDFLGTGVYSGEYVVASKHVSPRLAVTGGIGWGRFGSQGGFDNPLGVLSDGFKTRPSSEPGGGRFNTKTWFRGDAAFFGGIAWRASDALTLKAEYSSDAYAGETDLGLVERESSLNFGLSYRISPSLDLSLYHRFGNEVGFQFSSTFNPKRPPAGATPDAAPLAVAVRSANGAARRVLVFGSGSTSREERLSALLEFDGVAVDDVAISGNVATVQIRNLGQRSFAQAIGRTARAMSHEMPSGVEYFRIVPSQSGLLLSSVKIARSDIETLENAPDGAWQSYVRSSIEDAKAEGITLASNPRLDWSVGPYIDTELFDPDDPLRADIGLRAQGRLHLGRGIFLNGSVRKRAFGSLDNSTRPSTSVLQKVRSENALYNREGDPGIEHLAFESFYRPGPNLYGRFSFGYLEKMFGGISHELLWKPVDKRYAFGAELNYARQRDFDQLFGFQDYDTITGHVSAYYDLGNGFHTQLDVGRYLAEDWGATLTLDREFSNGFRVGAFATITDVSSDDFGEGSFDKGIRITVPITWVTGSQARDQYQTTIRPVLRDGGARLNVPNRLYETVRPAHDTILAREWARFWR